MVRHLHIDPFSGISGDMFLGALVDLGLEVDALAGALAPLELGGGFRITTERVDRHGIGAIDLKVRADNGAAGHTSRRQILAMIDRLDTTERARDRARRVVNNLAQAEARVHGKPLEEIHFHEVGAVDSIVDMLGSAVGLEELGVDTMSCGPLPVSHGFVECAHGLLPVPAPATAYLMQGLAVQGVDRDGELVTPTGAALAASLCESFGPPPAMVVERVGYGAGDRQYPRVPNVLRLLLGEADGAT